MRTVNRYDTPILAMIKAFNDFAGGECLLIELRDQWYFHMGSKEDNRFVYWLDLALEMVNEEVVVAYKRHPGWYTEVVFEVRKEIEI
jgi:hypothetical protein